MDERLRIYSLVLYFKTSSFTAHNDPIPEMSFAVYPEFIATFNEAFPTAAY